MSKKGIEADRKEWVDMRRQFGESVLRPKRIALGYNQTQIASEIGLDQSTISRIERGQRPKDLATVVAIVDGYGLNQDESDELLYLFSGILSSEHPSAYHLPQVIQPNWETARGMVRDRLSLPNYDILTLAREAGIPADTIDEFLRGKTTLDQESAMQLYSAMQPDMNFLNRRAFLIALGLLPITSSMQETIHESAATISADPLLEAYTDHVDTILKLRLDGNLPLVIEAATSVARNLEIHASDERLVKDRPAFLRLLAELLNCQGLTYSDIIVGTRLWAAETGFAAKLRYLDMKFKFAPFSGLAEQFWGDSFFVAGRFAEASRHLQAALPRIESVEHKFTTLTTLAKVWAFSNSPQKFEEERFEITRLIEDGHITNLESIAFAYGSLARSYASLDLRKEAFQCLEQEKSLVDQMKINNGRVLIRPAQAVRDEIVVLQQIDPTGHPLYLENQVEEGIRLAERCSCHRLVIQLQKRRVEISG